MKNKLIDLSGKSSKLNNMQYRIQDYSSSITEKLHFNQIYAMEYYMDLDEYIFSFTYTAHKIELNDNFRPFKRTK